MDILTDSELRPGRFAASAVAVGNFDGVHLGHQALIRCLVERGTALGGASIVYTFDPNPLRVLHPAACPPMLTDFADKASRVAQLGADVMVRVRFDREYAARPAEWFASDVLGDQLGAAEVWVGPDFAFGRARKGGPAMLSRVGAVKGYTVRSLPPVVIDGERVSSTRVREAVYAADFGEASRLLGRPFSLHGRVAHGVGRGKELGFPTANLAPREECLPPEGVYAARAVVAGKTLSAAVNIGGNPTFGPGAVTVEAHLLDFKDSLYGEEMEILFVRRIRGEIAFGSAEALAAQIGRDVAAVRGVLAEARA